MHPTELIAAEEWGIWEMDVTGAGACWYAKWSNNVAEFGPQPSGEWSVFWHSCCVHVGRRGHLGLGRCDTMSIMRRHRRHSSWSCVLCLLTLYRGHYVFVEDHGGVCGIIAFETASLWSVAVLLMHKFHSHCSGKEDTYVQERAGVWRSDDHS